MVRAHFLLTLCLGLAACGEEPAPPPEPPRDPQIAQALNDPLMTDPDLSSQNEGAAALTVESDFSLPVVPASPEEIARAKADAAAAVGGSDALVPPGDPRGSVAPLPADGPLTAHMAALPGRACTAPLAPGAIWAARMPQPIPVYPRGATIAAAGGDAKGCRLRVVTFTTPVAAEDVIAFYGAKTRAAKIPARYRQAGDDKALAGANAALAFDVRVRAAEGGTVVRIATRER